MPMLSAVLRRAGYVKLSDYSLALSPRGQVVTYVDHTRIDGDGSHVVGWRDDDVLATAMAKFQSKSPDRKVQFAAPPRAMASQAASVTTTVAAKPVESAPAIDPEEDDWEWQIALARARTSEETPLIRMAAITPIPALQRLPQRPDKPAAAAAAKTPLRRETSVGVAVPPSPPSEFETVTTFSSMTTEAPVAAPTVAAAPCAEPMPRRRRADTVPPPATQPRIAIPTLPTVATMVHAPAKPVAVVRSPADISAVSPPRRFPRGTGGVVPTSARNAIAACIEPVRSGTELAKAVQAVSLPSK